jgi:hypothetical protein
MKQSGPLKITSTDAQAAGFLPDLLSLSQGGKGNPLAAPPSTPAEVPVLLLLPAAAAVTAAKGSEAL